MGDAKPPSYRGEENNAWILIAQDKDEAVQVCALNMVVAVAALIRGARDQQRVELCCVWAMVVVSDANMKTAAREPRGKLNSAYGTVVARGVPEKAA